MTKSLGLRISMADIISLEINELKLVTLSPSLFTHNNIIMKEIPSPSRKDH